MVDPAILNTAFTLTAKQIGFFRKYGFIKLRQVLDADVVAHFNDVISRKVDELNDVHTPMAERSTYGKAFLQLFNLWREDAEVRKLVFSRRLAKIAADLLQVEGVRIYHDQALFKEAGGGITPWHADQYYWPLTTDRTVTAWIPLQKTPLEMGPLEFSAGSHVIQEGRELEIGDESEEVMRQRLRVTDFQHIVEPFDAGEVSLHSGWIFHRAGVNASGRMRKVMTVIYMDKDMRLKAPDNDNQRNDWETWCPGAKVGEVIQTPLNPVLYDGALIEKPSHTS